MRDLAINHAFLRLSAGVLMRSVLHSAQCSTMTTSEMAVTKTATIAMNNARSFGVRFMASLRQVLLSISIHKPRRRTLKQFLAWPWRGNRHGQNIILV